MGRPIEKLRLKHFRGASQTSEVTFDTKKSLVMVFGENGTGKSTIADALDLVANKSVGSLVHRSMGRKVRYLPTIGKKNSDLTVELVSGETTWSGKLVGQDITVDKSDGLPQVRVLRRAELLKLIEATPAERHDVLRGFIDVAGVESSEQALRDALRQAEGELTSAAQSLNDAQQTLEDWWNKEDAPGENAEEWAKSKSDADRQVLQGQVAEYDKIVKGLAEAVRTEDSLVDAKQKLAERDKELENIGKEIKALPDVNGQQAVQLMELLQSAQGFIAEPAALKTCPLCEQPVNVVNLRESISTRLSDMTIHKNLAERRTEAERQVNLAIQVKSTAQVKYVTAVRSSGVTLKSSDHRTDDVDAIPWHEFDEFLNEKTPESDVLTTSKSLHAHLRPLQDALSTLHDTTQADLNQLNAIKSSYDRIVANRERAESLETLVNRMRRAVKICEENRKTFTQGVLDSVAEESERLYELVHPDESLGSPRLRIDPKKRNSIDQDASFAGYPEIPPQAYFSESHLDTLGFCVWLAIAKRERADETLIVLDDIFTSVDGVHLTRIMSLLADIADDFLQVIVTTHYRTWRDRYRLHQAPGFTVQLLELHRWSLNRGIAISGTKLAIDDLREVLETEPFNRQAAASQAGILLEAVLDRLTIQYRRKLPRNHEGAWTLGDLLNGCSKLFKVLEVQKPRDASDVAEGDGDGDGDGEGSTLHVKIQPFVDAFDPLVFIRNQVGCHFNLAGCEVADNDVESFGKATVDLAEALMCPLCGDMVSRRAGSFFQCGCNTAKMTPLEFSR